MREAFEVLSRLTRAAGHEFWPIHSPLQEATAFCADRLFGPGQLTDAYLLSLAIEQSGILVTFDRGILQLAGPKYARYVHLLT
jgi:predicted nucleic acid-binding protein